MVERLCELPAIICSNLTVKATATTGSIKGLIAVFDTFTVDKASESQTLPIIGRVITSKCYIKERQPWDTTNWNWLLLCILDLLSHDDTLFSGIYELVQGEIINRY